MSALDVFSRAAVLRVLLLAAGLAGAVWTVLTVLREDAPLARAALLPLALWILGLRHALSRGWLSTHAVWLGGLVAASALALLELAEQFFDPALLPGLSAGALWYSLPYLLAFMVFSPRVAYTFTTLYLLFGAGLTVSSVVVLSSSGAMTPFALSARLQFVLFNLMAVTLLWTFTRLRRAQLEQSRLESLDPLTGLLNRRALEPTLEREMMRASRYGTPLALLLVDVDHFKALNEQHGRTAGDAVLREVAARLSGLLRKTDALTRWAGEEFLILAPETDLEHAALLAERILETMRAGPVGAHPVTVSLGVSSYQTGDSLEELLARAESALYRAKNRGRNRAEVVATRPRLNTAF